MVKNVKRLESRNSLQQGVKMTHIRTNGKAKGGSAKRPEPTAAEIEASKEGVRQYNDYLTYGVPLEDAQIEKWTQDILEPNGDVKTDVGAINAEIDKQLPQSQDPNKFDTGLDNLSAKNKLGNNLQQDQLSQLDRGLLASYQIGQGQEASIAGSQQEIANRHARDVLRNSSEKFQDSQINSRNIGNALGTGLSEYEDSRRGNDGTI